MQYPWTSALVTGASSGIGEAIARQLATAGVDVTVVARRTDRLEEIATDHPGVVVVAADLTESTDVSRVAELLNDPAHPIELLVNCAGVGASGPFVDGSIDIYHQLIDLNVSALVTLTHAAIGPMGRAGRGWIINISSLGGHTPGPSFAVYSATKAFVTSFSESLFEESRKAGVVVTAVCPGATRTEFGETAGAVGDDLPAMLWQTADEVAAESLEAAARGRAVRVTGTINRITGALTTVMPRAVNRRLSGLVTSKL